MILNNYNSGIFNLDLNICFYLIFYILFSLIFWYTLLFLTNSQQINTFIVFSNIKNKKWILYYTLLIFFISGTPPFLLFFIKLKLINFVVQNSMFLYSIITFLILMWLSFFYIQLLKYLFVNDVEQKFHVNYIFSKKLYKVNIEIFCLFIINLIYLYIFNDIKLLLLNCF